MRLQDAFRAKAGPLEHGDEATEGPNFTWRGSPGRDIPERGKYYRKVYTTSCNAQLTVSLCPLTDSSWTPITSIIAHCLLLKAPNSLSSLLSALACITLGLLGV